jgi:N-acetylmuramoyl-L-alanine amidase
MAPSIDERRRTAPLHRGRLAALAWGTLAALAGLAALGAAEPDTLRVALEPGLVAGLGPGHELFVEALPEKGEGLLAFSRRLTGGEAAAAAIAEANGGDRELRAGVRYRVPFRQLRGELQLRAARAVFADDRAEPGGWRHTVRRRGGLEREGLWQVALWFTGRGENFRALREVNGLDSEDLDPGDSVLIPPRLLLAPFRSAVAATAPAAAASAATPTAAGAPAAPGTLAAAAGPSAPDPADPAAAADGGDSPRLEYGQDAGGKFAAYRLRPGEALYSSVVVRFTGRLLAADVNALAGEIATRSGIADVTDIPVGYAVKIPLDLLQPEYLPAGDPRRREYEAALEASARFGNRVRAVDLSGVTVILDPGHGGRDVGASFAGVWESLYVYDIMLRVRHLLESYTDARVLATVRDGDRTVPEDRDKLSFSRGHRVLTNPPYPIEVAAVGTNLRWYLANSVYRREVAGGLDPDKLVFVSFHADSLHPSLRGAMVYVPDASLRGGTFGRSGPDYAARREYREKPRVSFSWQERVKSEGLSRDLANQIVRAFRGRGLPVHPFKPVREKIIRRHSEYVPAVLRYNEVPAKVLVEVCNLANPQDREAIQTRHHREEIAEAVVEGLLAYYGHGDLPGAGRVAAAR